MSRFAAAPPVAWMVSTVTPIHDECSAIVIICAVAAVITPSGDPISMLALAIPMYLFYELSIVFGWFVNRRKRKRADKAEKAASEAS